MTLCGKLEGEVEIKAPAELFHDVFSCRPHHINIMSPDKIHGVDLHEGDWGKPGTVICWSYTHDGKTKIAKELIEDIDDKNLSTTYRVIEGSNILEEYKDFKIIVQATPKEEGGSIVHWTFEYEKLHEGIPDPHTLLDFVLNTSKDVCSHLSQPQPQN